MLLIPLETSHQRKLDASFVRSVKEDEELRRPFLLNDTQISIPNEQYLRGEFFYLETNQKVYYPGDLIEVYVHLRTYKTLPKIDTLTLQVKGIESFRFNSKVKSMRSLQNKRTIVDQTFSVCRFVPSELTRGDYTFQFKYKVPSVDPNSQN